MEVIVKSDFGGCHRVTLIAVAKADKDSESKCREKVKMPQRSQKAAKMRKGRKKVKMPQR